MHGVVLKKGREAIFKERHHWIFSGAIEAYPESYTPGELVPICSHAGEILGYGFFNPRNSLAGRIVTFGKNDPYKDMQSLLKSALELRKSLLQSARTTAFRLINGEGDALPGLIVDKYGPYLVVQTGALGMRRLLPFFIEQLQALLPIQGIYDKSKNDSLREERIEASEGILFGDVPEKIEILENGIRYEVFPKVGQKTGFFLDHREMRSWVRELAKGKKVLNCFCYTGGFTLSALTGGATHVDSVDSSPIAIDQCRAHISLNGFSDENTTCYRQDVFDFLTQKSCDYDLVILDPPAFAKKKKDIPTASKGYKRLFKLALEKMPKSSQLLLSSCSYYITEPIFENIVRSAAQEAGRSVKIIGHHRLASDHPINLFHPESAYLKSLLLHIA